MPQRLLWIDCIGGMLVGCVVLLLSQSIASLDQLPLGVILFTGVANLVYGSFSLNLAVRKERPMILIGILAWANMFWLVVCCVLTTIWWNEISMLGILHLIGEGIFVAGLGAVEWQQRESLRNA